MKGYHRPVRFNEKHRAVAFPSSAQTCPQKRDRAWHVFLILSWSQIFSVSTVRFLLLKMRHAMVVEVRILPHTCIHGILATTMPANLVEWVANISGWWYWTHHPILYCRFSRLQSCKIIPPGISSKIPLKISSNINENYLKSSCKKTAPNIIQTHLIPHETHCPPVRVAEWTPPPRRSCWPSLLTPSSLVAICFSCLLYLYLNYIYIIVNI